MNDQLMYDHLTAEIRKTIPKFQVVPKNESWFMRFLGKVLFFNKSFMAGYFTTIYPTVYVPVGTDPLKFIWSVLAHEWVHLLRAKKHLVRFSFMYLLPFSLLLLAPLSLLAIWGSSLWLWNLLWIPLALLPLPSYPKAYEERIAYRMTLAVEIWRYGSTTEASKEYIVDKFTSGDYYFMWPFRKTVKKWFDKEEKDILSGKYQNVFPYSVVHGLIKDEKAGALAPLE